MREHTDETLMQEVALGSRDAFRWLLRRWQRPLYRFFVFMGVDRGSAEDCIQETFLRIFVYRERYRRVECGFRGFLFRVSRNVAVDFFRKKRRLGTVVPMETPPRTEDAVPFWNDCFDCEWALGLLTERLRVVVILNVFEGLSYRETAAALEVPVGTVKSRMYHALAQLREILRVDVQS